ncbi:MAG: hypothetical protein HYW28_07640 [Rhodospirillales bacterium]|nr:hypothetical protein [Rhodospirillales bacterium]
MADGAKKKIDLSILSLHTHWITADAVKERIRLDVKGSEGQLSRELEALGQHFSRIQAMVVFYGLLYVVVEGYRELKLKDEAIDALLCKDQYENLLRRFRNAVFHFQKYPFDKRLVEFLIAENSEHWVRELHGAFSRFFIATLPIKDSLDRMNRQGGIEKAMRELSQ